MARETGLSKEHVDLARPERLHARLLLGGRHLPVEEPDPQPLELAGPQLIGPFGGRLGLDALRPLDERIDDVRLAAGVELLGHEIVVFGMSAQWSGPLAIEHAVMADAIDVEPVWAALGRLGLNGGGQLSLERRADGIRGGLKRKAVKERRLKRGK